MDLINFMDMYMTKMEIELENASRMNHNLIPVFLQRETERICIPDFVQRMMLHVMELWEWH